MCIARALADNAMRYLAPEHKIIDPEVGLSGRGLESRSQAARLLAVVHAVDRDRLWIELLANVAAGNADTPGLGRDEALRHLAFTVQTLRKDQHDPTLSAKGLLGNFLDVSTGKRLGPLASSVEKEKVLEAFGPEQGHGSVAGPEGKGLARAPTTTTARPTSNAAMSYGWMHFDGPLKPFADDKTRQKLMGLLDERVVMVVFGDNANLSTSVAKAIGALLPLGDRDAACSRSSTNSKPSSTTSSRATSTSTTASSGCSISAGTPARIA